MRQKLVCYFLIIACLVEAQVKIITLKDEAIVKVSDKLIKSLKDELNYESILVLHNPIRSCKINLNIKTPVVYFNEHQNLTIKPKFKRRFLTLVCLNQVNFGVLKALFINLDGMRETPTLLFVNKGVKLAAVFKKCLKNKMLNVLAIENWNRTQIYSFRAFPYFKLIKREISEVRRYFEPQIKDMGGFPILTMPDNILPRSVIYMDALGDPHLTGYLVTFLSNFAQTLNATLRVSWNQVDLDFPDETLGREVLRSVGRGIVDIPLSIVNIGPYANWQQIIPSQVMEISKWQLMLPIEPELDSTVLLFAGGNYNNVYYTVLLMTLFALLLENNQRLELGESPSLWCLVPLMDTVLRALLYQTCALPRRATPRLRRIYLILFLFSFLSYNIYITHLEMMLVHPPRGPPIRNYQDMRRSNLKILLTPDERSQMMSIIGQTDFWDVHQMVNRSVFQAMRRLPNTSYAYPITQTLWPLIQHKFIKQPRQSFRLSNDFIFLSLVPFGIPLPRNSIYEEILNRFILNTQCSGLYPLWFRRTFQSLVTIGKMEVLPYQSVADYYHILGCFDFGCVWIFYGCYTAVSILIFVIELGLGYVKRRGYLLGVLKVDQQPNFCP